MTVKIEIENFLAPSVSVDQSDGNISVGIESYEPVSVAIETPAGLKGDKGLDGENANMQAVNHGSDANLSRPDFDVVFWVGSVEPVNAIDGDVWLDF
jgi:hypothetical protein